MLWDIGVVEDNLLEGNNTWDFDEASTVTDGDKLLHSPSKWNLLLKDNLFCHISKTYEANLHG
jgi:hypothetical protein